MIHVLLKNVAGAAIDHNLRDLERVDVESGAGDNIGTGEASV